MALANGLGPITDAERDQNYQTVVQELMMIASMNKPKPHTICAACFDGTCEKSTDNPCCFCCVSNHVI